MYNESVSTVPVDIDHLPVYSRLGDMIEEFLRRREETKQHMEDKRLQLENATREYEMTVRTLESLQDSKRVFDGPVKTEP